MLPVPVDDVTGDKVFHSKAQVPQAVGFKELIMPEICWDCL